MDEHSGIQRTLGTLQEGVSSLQRFASSHTSDDDRHFSEVYSRFDGVDDKLSIMGLIQATVAKHEVQLAEMEDAMTAREKTDSHRQGVTETNAKWIKITGIIILAVAARVYAPDIPHLFEGIASLFK